MSQNEVFPLEVFLSQLFESGEIVLDLPVELSDDEIERAVCAGKEFESIYRLELPNETPPFSEVGFRWAAINFYHAIHLLVHREVPANEAKTELSERIGVGQDASVQYSVDLVFRFLGDLRKFTLQLDKDDPVRIRVETWCRQWPLSSVGVEFNDLLIPGFLEGEEHLEQWESQLDSILGNACLKQLYVDRVIATRDRTRMKRPEVSEAVRAALGIHSGLADGIFEGLEADGPGNGKNTVENSSQD